MKDKDAGKIIKKPYLFYTLIAIPIVILNVVNAVFFNLGAVMYALFTLIGFYLGKWVYFRYFNIKKKV